MRRDLVILLAVFALLYLFFPGRILESDAVIYACGGLARDMVQSTDAGHLAWGFLEIGAADLGRRFTPPLHPIALLRPLASLAALGSLWCCFRALLLLGTDRRRALILTAALGATYTFWHFAVQAESHLPSTFFLAAFAVLALRHFQQPDRRSAAAVGVLLGLSTLLHQTSILMVPAFLAPVFLRERGLRGGLRCALPFAAAYFATAIVPYLAVGWFVRDLRDYAAWREWILGLSLWGWWGDVSPRSLPAAGIGLGRSFTGSHYLLGFGPLADLARRLVPNASWDDELLLARSVPVWLRALLPVIQAAVTLGALEFLRRSLVRLPACWRADRSATLFLALWLGVYGPFIVWWAPIRAEFWIAVLLPLLLLAGACRAPLPTGRRAGWLLVVGLLLVNFLGSVLPQSRGDLEPEAAVLTAVDAVTRPGDFLLSDSDLIGRVSRFVYTLDKVNLLAPSSRRTTRLSPGALGPDVPLGARGAAAAADTLSVPALADPVARALGTVAAVLAAAAREDRAVLLLRTPLDPDPGRRALYARILAAVDARYDTSQRVALRAAADLRRLR